MTTCQLYMRRFSDGAVITIEPWRARAFPIIRIWWWITERWIESCRQGGYLRQYGWSGGR